MLNKEILRGKWHEVKGKIKEKWANLTDDDIARINGNYEQLIGTLEKKYGYEKERAKKEVDSWCEKCQNHATSKH